MTIDKGIRTTELWLCVAVLIAYLVVGFYAVERFGVDSLSEFGAFLDQVIYVPIAYGAVRAAPKTASALKGNKE